MRKLGASMRILRFLPLVLVLGLLLAIPGGNISAATVSLDITNPVCVQSQTDTSTCYIKAFSIDAYGSDTSFSQLRVFVDGKLRVNMQGFFEANAYLSSDMLGDGLAVSCGGPNASGDPNFGKFYTMYVTASMGDGANTWGSAQVRCPYYEGKTYLPGVR